MQGGFLTQFLLRKLKYLFSHALIRFTFHHNYFKKSIFEHKNSPELRQNLNISQFYWAWAGSIANYGGYRTFYLHCIYRRTPLRDCII